MQVFWTMKGEKLRQVWNVMSRIFAKVIKSTVLILRCLEAINMISA